jgi:ABC-type xylose transport system substrate-binding protein
VLWQRFDQTITRLSTVAAGTDMLAVARAYEELAEIAAELSEAVVAEDGLSPRSRARRSA